jgi:hypothetical protein
LFVPRNYTTTLADSVPIMKSCQHLKAHFDWLADGGISHNIKENLPEELEHLEMYIRLLIFCEVSPNIMI